MAGFYGRVGVQMTETVSEGAASLTASLREAVTRAVLAGAEPIRQRAYELANVSTGVQGHGRNGEHMRDEIKVKVYDYETGVSARIMIDMGVIPYAAHQEFGPRGKPFMRPAVDECRTQSHEAMGESLRADLIVRGAKTKVRFRSFA